MRGKDQKKTGGSSSFSAFTLIPVVLLTDGE